jgi:cyanamide hydratase
MSNSTKIYGFTALPADQSLQNPRTTSPAPVDIASLAPPHTPLATRVAAYAKAKLDVDTYRHSLRVYSYGCAIARQCFPEFELTPGSALDETWFLTAILHDIGTAAEFMTRTRLSFEFWGGYHALELLQDPTITGGGEGVAPREQAESVAEAIIRHSDIQDKGYITLVTRLIHLGTLLDNIGASAELINKQTIENVVSEYPRPGWSGCFTRALGKEKAFKSYAMVARIEGFEGMIRKNGSGEGLMSKYD